MFGIDDINALSSLTEKCLLLISNAQNGGERIYIQPAPIHRPETTKSPATEALPPPFPPNNRHLVMVSLWGGQLTGSPGRLAPGSEDRCFPKLFMTYICEYKEKEKSGVVVDIRGIVFAGKVVFA